MARKKRDRAPDAQPGDGKCPYLKNDGSRCKLSAGFGTDHLGFGACRFHQGNMKPERAKAAEERAIVMYGASRDGIDPFAALLEELYRTSGHVAWLQGKVQEAEQDDDLWHHEAGGVHAEPKKVPSIWIQMYAEERDRLRIVAKTCIDAGIAERQVRIAEDTGRLIAQVLRGALRELGVAEHPDVDGVVRRQLTAVSGS